MKYIAILFLFLASCDCNECLELCGRYKTPLYINGECYVVIDIGEGLETKPYVAKCTGEEVDWQQEIEQVCFCDDDLTLLDELN